MITFSLFIIVYLKMNVKKWNTKIESIVGIIITLVVFGNILPSVNLIQQGN